MTYLLFALGFVALVKGASLLVEGASSIARRFNVSDFALGNVPGSNIFNIYFVLGVTATVRPLPFPFADQPRSAGFERIEIMPWWERFDLVWAAKQAARHDQTSLTSWTVRACFRNALS